jgi:hypothetical protein
MRAATTWAGWFTLTCATALACVDSPTREADGGADSGADLGDGGRTELQRAWNVGPGFDTSAYQDCTASGVCSPGLTCFRLAPDLAVCDAPPLPRGQMCSGPGSTPVTDECGCDALTCDAGQMCVAAEVWCSCAPQVYNGCVDLPCATPADCAGGTVCTPPSLLVPAWAAPPPTVRTRCADAACRSDAECEDGAQGRCAMLLVTPTQQGEMGLRAVRCVYAGSSDTPGVCSGTTPQSLGGDFYTCPALAH